MTKNRDWRLEGLENYGTFQPFSVSGKFEIPAIAPVTELKPLEWRCFGEYRTLSINPNTGIHFFTDDYRFTHVHVGYEHNEIADRNLNDKERSFVYDILTKWESKRKRLHF